MPDPDPETRRFRLDIAYDGRPFVGWQSQVGGDTVQDILQAAVRQCCPAASGVHGSGRTDTGVCAEQQTAHFDAPAEWNMRGGEWQRALNSQLPAAIRVLRCSEIDPAFHARFSVLEKTYRYNIATGEILPPLEAGLAWHRKDPGPETDLQAVLDLYVGTHDFRAFSAKRHDGKDETRDAVRTISRAEVSADSSGTLSIRFTGNGFLYKMVRFLVGTAVYCIEGKITREDIRHLLSGADRDAKAPYCAPPDGLSLVDVRYPEEFEIFR